MSKDDASLVCQVAAALSDAARQAATRKLIQLGIGDTVDVSLKTLLASAPLDGIDLDRAHDTGRAIDL